MDKKTPQQIWKETHREQHLKSMKDWRADNREICNAYGRKHTAQTREKMFVLLGDRCVNPDCLISGGCRDKRALQFDHIDGFGNKDRARFPNVRIQYKYYLDHPDEAKQKLQVLCANCNWIKRFEKKENRRQTLKSF